MFRKRKKGSAAPRSVTTVGWWAGLLLLFMLFTVGLERSAHADTALAPRALIEANQETVKDLLAVFERAESAIKKRDLDGVLALYSEHYDYHGLRKSDVGKIWASLFEGYRHIMSTHRFSIIRMKSTARGLAAEITCTGSLWATSEPGKLRIPIDSWHDEVHQVIREDGAWRILGNAGEAPKVLPFGTAPHPLF